MLYRCLMLAGACAAALSHGTVGQAQSVVSVPRIDWIPFEWASAEVGDHTESRAMLLVPVIIPGALPNSYFLQLDTGAGWSKWYEAPLRAVLPHALPADSTPDELASRGSIGGYEFQSDTFEVLKAFGRTPQDSVERVVVGTLGLRFFRKRTLIIDFPRQRFAILDSARPLPPELVSRMSFVPITYRNGHAFVAMRIGGEPIEDFFFDSGASLYALTTTHASWRIFTGRTGDEADNIRHRVRSWGAVIETVGAPATAAVEFGSVRFDQPLVYFDPPDSTGREFFNSLPYRVGGHFGNALFYDRFIVVLDLPRRRFGLLEEP